jgi:hypothetical protein
VSFRLTVRYSATHGAKVDHEHFEDLDDAIDGLSRRLGWLADDARRKRVDLGVREFDPVQQVAARLEVAGPSRLRPRYAGGIDIRGDGSVEAYTGRVKRVVVELEDGESAVEGLRRALGATAR